MKAIIQRVCQASVTVEGKTIGQIGPGMLALVAVVREDGPEDVAWMSGKLLGLRIFRDGEKHFDRSVAESGGSVLLVSNFTVAADTRKGRRPSFDAAAEPQIARKLFDELVQSLRATCASVVTGEFGAAMIVSLQNDGPATFILDSRS